MFVRQTRTVKSDWLECRCWVIPLYLARKAAAAPCYVKLFRPCASTSVLSFTRHLQSTQCLVCRTLQFHGCHMIDDPWLIFWITTVETTQQHRASQQQAAEEQLKGSTDESQAGPDQASSAGRDPHNRPVALETPKDQYNRHLEAARSRSGSLGHRHSSPRHALPINGEPLAY